MIESDVKNLLALGLIPKIGHKGIKQLIAYCGSSAAVFETPKSKLLKIPGVGQKLSDMIVKANTMHAADDIIGQCEKLGIQILPFTHSEYPYRLKEIIDAPNILYKKGNASCNGRKVVAIVGTRSATPYGKQITEGIVRDLKKMDCQVVSGLAYGIDIQAHKTCIDLDVTNFAVFACGLGQVYPTQHTGDAQKILSNGAWISENVPSMRPEKYLFPNRNRLIAGMADAVIVVEAAQTGGALITAMLAHSYNRLVMAVPGKIGHKYSEGTNALITQQIATIYTKVEDLVVQLSWDLKKLDNTSPVSPKVSLEGSEKVIFDFLSLSQEPIDIDLIAVKTQLVISDVASTLLSLEIQGLVKRYPGKKFGSIR